MVSQLISHGRVKRGYLGISARNRPLGTRIVRHHRLESDTGVEVVIVDLNGPGHAAGVKVGDIAVAFDAKPVKSVDDLHRILTEIPIDEPTIISVLRGRRKLHLSVVPRELEKAEE